MTRGECKSSQALRDRRNIVFGGRGGDGLRKLAKGNPSVAAEAERSSLQLFLPGEQEYQTARLARVRLGDIEVEGGSKGRIDCAVESSAVGVIRLSRVDSDH